MFELILRALALQVHIGHTLHNLHVDGRFRAQELVIRIVVVLVVHHAVIRAGLVDRCGAGRGHLLLPFSHQFVPALVGRCIGEGLMRIVMRSRCGSLALVGKPRAESPLLQLHGRGRGRRYWLPLTGLYFNINKKNNNNNK